MAIEKSCAACGCNIADNRTSAGMAMRHGGKLYCAECAAMILPPEELERQSNAPVTALPIVARNKAPRPAPAQPSPPPVLIEEDELGEEAPQEEPVVEKPGKSRVLSASRVRNAVSESSSRQATVVVGRRKPSTRATFVPPPGAARASSRRSESVVVARRDSGASSSASNSRSTARMEKENQSGRESGSKGKKGKSDSMGLYIGLGIGAVVILVAGYFILAPGSSSAKTAKAKPKAELVDNDKTPSYEYARTAEDFAAKRDTSKAVKFYTKAAERAEKEGNTQKAKEYNMQAITLDRAATLH